MGPFVASPQPGSTAPEQNLADQLTRLTSPDSLDQVAPPGAARSEETRGDGGSR